MLEDKNLHEDKLNVSSSNNETNGLNSGISLFKNYDEYKSILQFTGLTGAYNLYLDRNKKALIMMVTLVVSSILLILQELFITQEEIILFAYLGLLVNGIIWIMDFMNYKDDVDEYNENIELTILNYGKNEVYTLKAKNVGDYTSIIAVFGFMGLDRFYVDKYSFTSFRYILFGLPILSYTYCALMKPIIFLLYETDILYEYELMVFAYILMFIMFIKYTTLILIVFAGMMSLSSVAIAFDSLSMLSITVSPYAIIAIIFLISIDIWYKLFRANKLLEKYNNELEEYISNFHEEDIKINQFNFL